ncbi:MAG: hypothetical protein LBG86_00770 [Puniceicoccales bacterium]|jgi:hypothetical protein|nr:hypothetical protein [Puniceicoccales bacterium]
MFFELQLKMFSLKSLPEGVITMFNNVSGTGRSYTRITEKNRDEESNPNSLMKVQTPSITYDLKGRHHSIKKAFHFMAAHFHLKCPVFLFPGKKKKAEIKQAKKESGRIEGRIEKKQEKQNSLLRNAKSFFHKEKNDKPPEENMEDEYDNALIMYRLDGSYEGEGFDDDYNEKMLTCGNSMQLGNLENEPKESIEEQRSNPVGTFFDGKFSIHKNEYDAYGHLNLQEKNDYVHNEEFSRDEDRKVIAKEGEIELCPKALDEFQRKTDAHGNNPYRLATTRGIALFCVHMTTDKKTSLYDDKTRQKYGIADITSGCDINWVGHSCITASPLQNNDGKISLFPMMEAVHENDIPLIVDVSNHAGNSYFPYLHPAQLNNLSQSKQRDHIPDPHDFSHWQFLDSHNPLKKENIPNDAEIPTMEELQGKAIQAQYKGKTVRYMKRPFQDGSAMNPAGLLKMCKEIDALAGDRPPLFHCNAGVGRSATMLCAYNLYGAMKNAKIAGRGVIYDMKNQRTLEINGKVNLAYVARGLMFTGRESRSAFIQGMNQFQCIENFGKFLAENPQ